MNSDPRGWRMALLPDALLNPEKSISATGLDVLQVVEANGYGVLQLPPSPGHGLLLAIIADQIAEYSHHGYAVVAISVRASSGDGLHWRSLVPLLRFRGVALPPRHLIRPDVDLESERQRLSMFLAAYDLPAEERQRWRV